MAGVKVLSLPSPPFVVYVKCFPRACKVRSVPRFFSSSFGLGNVFGEKNQIFLQYLASLCRLRPFLAVSPGFLYLSLVRGFDAAFYRSLSLFFLSAFFALLEIERRHPGAPS